MSGINWHQVLTDRVVPLAEGLRLPPTTGYNYLRFLADAGNTDDVVVCFDTAIRRDQGRYTVGRGKRLPTDHHIRLKPGDWDDVAVDESLDCGSQVYGVARSGRQDLYVMANR